MKYLPSLIATIGLTAAASLQASIPVTSEDFTYSQDFNSLPSTAGALSWVDDDTIPGWFQNYAGTIATTTEHSFAVVPDGNGLVTSGGVTDNNSARFANLGRAGTNDRSVGLNRNFSTSGAVGVVFQNDTGVALPGITVGYTGKQWRRGRQEETPLYFEYQIVSDVNNLDINSAPSNWTRVDALQFNSPRFDSGTVNLDLDGDWPAHRTVIDPVAVVEPIPVGNFLVARWYQDRTNSAGESTNSYHILAIDDVSISFEASVPLLAVEEIEVAEGEAENNFDFGFFYFGNPATESESRTVEFSNIAEEDVIIESIAVADSAGGAFALGATASVPFTVPAGATFDVEVLLTGAVTGGENLNGQLLIESKLASAPSGQSVALETPLTGQIFTAGDRFPLNVNPSLDSDLSGWTGEFSILSVAPGFGGSSQKVRIRGSNDLGEPDTFGQDNIPDFLSDFEVKFSFAISDFQTAVGQSADPSLQDRSFQFILHSDGDIELATDGTWNDDNVSSALVTLAYLPAGNGSDGEGFYVFDGSSWQFLSSLGTIEESIDSDGNGALDSTTADTVNVYQLTLTGLGFGTPTAAYDVAISGANTTSTAATATNLTTSHGSDITQNIPAGYLFTTGDRSTESGSNDTFDFALASSFWVDEVSFTVPAVLPFGLLEVDATPTFRVFTNRNTPGDVTVTNIGLGQDVVISGATFDEARFSALSSSLPLTLLPGETGDLVIVADSFGFTEAAAFRTDGEIISNDAIGVTQTGLIEAFVYPVGNNILGSFEVPGTDPVDDTDTFAAWEESSQPDLVTDVSGLAPGSNTAAFINTGSGITQPLIQPLEDFEIELYFAINPAPGRQFSLQLSSVGGFPEQVNLRYQDGEWSAFNGSSFQTFLSMNLTPSVDSDGDGDLDGPGDSKTVYRLVLSGRGFAGPVKEYDFAVYDASGTLVDSAENLQIFRRQTFAAISGVVATAQFGSSPGFWVDDFVVTGTSEAPTRFRVTDTAFDPNANPNTSIRWVDIGGEYEILGSNDLAFDELNTVTIPVTTGNGTIDDTVVSGEREFSFDDEQASGSTRFWRVRQIQP